MTNAEIDIMTAGHLCFDVIPRFPDTGLLDIGEILRPGKLVHVGQAKMSTGGPVSNTGIALRKLGLGVCFSARIGDDEFGRLTLDAMRRHGDAEGIRVVPGAISSYTVAIAPPGIDRIFLHNPGANDAFGVEDLPRGLMARCRHFHFGYPPLMRGMYADGGKTLEDILKMAKESGMTTSCDMALPDPASAAGQAPWARILERILPYMDIFLPSVEEALYMLEPERFAALKAEHRNACLIDVLRGDDYSRLAEQLLSFGGRMTALKAGHRGWYFRTGAADSFAALGRARPGDERNWADRELWCPAFRPQGEASATGAGDSSIAGFLAAFLRGLSVEQCLKYAVCLGYQNVLVPDAVSGIRSWDETTRLLDDGLPLIDFEIGTPGWQWNVSREIWAGPRDPLGALPAGQRGERP